MKKYLLFLFSFLSAIYLFAQDEDEFQIVPGTGNVAYSVKVDGTIFALAATPDGNTLIAAVGTDLFIMDFKTGALKKYIEIDDLAEAHFEEMELEEEPDIGYIRSLDVLPNSQGLIIGGIGGIILLNLSDYSIKWYAEGHEDPMSTQYNKQPSFSAYRVRATSDGQRILSSSQDDTKLKFWKATDGTLIRTIDTGFEESVEDIAIASDGQQIAVCNHQMMNKLTIDGEKVWSMRGSYEGSLEFSPDNTSLAFSQWGSKAYIAVGNANNMATEDGKRRTIYHQTSPKAKTVAGIVWTSDSQSLFTAANGNVCPVSQHKIQGAELISTIIADDFEVDIDADRTVVLGLNGTHLAVAGSDDEIRVFKIN